MKLNYPEKTMSQLVEDIAAQYPEAIAYEFYGVKTTYRQFNDRIHRTARALLASGIRRDDAVTICMPNIPQAIDSFYAVNRIGAVCNMVHPLSAEMEIVYYLTISESRMIITVDLFYEKVKQAMAHVPQPVTIVVVRMQDELPTHLAAAYAVRKGMPYMRFPDRGGDVTWKKFLKRGTPDHILPDHIFDTKHTAAILYSGGTSGVPKGICLSDMNFNACALSARDSMATELVPGLRMLSCMPVFHGFGLGINIHTVLIHGATCILMPTFTAKTYGEMLIKKKPNFIAGVPTIFEALLHVKALENAKLDFLMGMFCGGDSLSVELKKKIDAFLKEHGASIQVREGYGLTECVTASCLTPKDVYKEGSIGLPFADIDYAIVRPGTDEELPAGEEGEIILTGPTVMIKYLKNEEETAETLRVLADGRTWLYTGDLGFMDEEGYVYFRQRIKRMIITNGYNVYPGQLENIIDGCDEVAYSCVIGVPDTRRMHRVRAYVVLRENAPAEDVCREHIMEQLSLHIAKYALPREIIFKSELPKTLVGKVAYRQLEEEAEAEQEKTAEA